MRFIILAIAALTIMSFKATDTNNYSFDPNSSTLYWYAKKVTGKHNGGVTLKGGELTLVGDEIKAAKFIVDMTSITVSDIADAGTNAKLVSHLKADDFFGADKHQEATFVLKKATIGNPIAIGKSYNIEGTFTIKGINNDVTFPITVVKSGNNISAIGKITIDRTKYGIKYHSKSFLPNIGDKAIDDNFDIEVKLSGKAK